MFQLLTWHLESLYQSGGGYQICPYSQFWNFLFTNEEFSVTDIRPTTECATIQSARIIVWIPVLYLAASFELGTFESREYLPRIDCVEGDSMSNDLCIDKVNLKAFRCQCTGKIGIGPNDGPSPLRDQETVFLDNLHYLPSSLLYFIFHGNNSEFMSYWYI